MTKILLAITILLFSTSLLADPIEGKWQVDGVKMKKIIASQTDNNQFMLAILATGAKEMVFHQNGKLVLPVASRVGSWKKRAKDYLLIIDEDKIPAFIDKGALKLKPEGTPPSAFVILNKQSSLSTESPEMIAKNKKIAAMIQYERLYLRTTKHPDGTDAYLKISRKNKTCYFISSDRRGTSKSTTSDSCSVHNGYLYMGPILGRAEIISANKIKHGNDIYILQK